MSGASANAAARRRRLAPTPTPSQQSTPQQIQNQEQTKQNMPLTPINILKMHETRINKLEEENKKLIEQLLNSNTVTESNGQNNLTSRLDNLESMFNKKTIPHTEMNNDNKKIIELESEICELKKLITKIQTFAMETNLSLMKYKSNNVMSGGNQCFIQKKNTEEAATEEAATGEATTEEAATEEAATEEAATEEAATEEAATEEAAIENAATEEAATEENLDINELHSQMNNLISNDLQEYFANQVNK
jgi:hypothetical protein